ncbi:MAG: holo-[acyl-carrier-protein] synthase [Ruminococcus sp.]|nr:holo-[acyl-carrier-protein] synthase [Ruminococcus sp.]
MEIGIDLVEIARIKKSIQIPGFIEKVYSPEEIQLYKARKNRIEVLAGRFCVKEAFGKAIGTGVRDFELNEVSTLTDELGRPYVVLSGNAKKIAGDKKISVSITHTNEYAQAAVILY